MRVLLDTHTWIWMAGTPERLPIQVQSILDLANTDCFLSPISVWEVLLLARKNRIVLDREPMAWVEASVEQLRLSILPITLEIAMDTNRLDGFDRQDPGDRFIVATARVHQLTLLTADEWILRWPGVKTLW